LADAVCGIAVDKRKAESCRAGGVEGAGCVFFEVRIIVCTHYRFYAVRCFGGGSFYTIDTAPVVRGWVYGDGLRIGYAADGFAYAIRRF